MSQKILQSTKIHRSEEMDWYDIVQTITDVTSSEKMDTKRWTLEDSSLYSVKSSKYCVLVFHHVNEEVAKCIWKGKIIKKSCVMAARTSIAYFFCLICLE